MTRTWRNLAATSVAAVTMLTGWTAFAQPTASAQGPASTRGAARPVPTLGLRTGLFARGSGFGQVRPKKVYNGGDPTGLVTSISWHNWGKGQAVGTGRAVYVGPNQSVAQGKIEPVRIVAFDLGNCDGHYMYAAVEWYFPQHKQVFNANRFEDVCIGTYYPPTGTYRDGAHGYTITARMTKGTLTGSVTQGKRVVFGFYGRAAVNGTLTLVSRGPLKPGHTFTGSWRTFGLTLKNCHAYLAKAPSCSFS